MTNPIILQIKDKYEYETLYVFSDGRIICECLNNMYNKGRDHNSDCKHATRLRDKICSGDISEYTDVTPKH